MQYLIEAFVHNPVKVTVGVLLATLFGVLSMLSMPMQLIPDVQTPTLTIETIWPGASPQEVERVIVQEQEKQLKSVEGVRKMTSESHDSLGRVTLEFPVGTDMSTAEIKVNSRLQQVPFYPEDVKEPVIKTANASDRPIAWFMLMELPPSEEEIRTFQKAHPELSEPLEKVIVARNDGLKLLRLRRLAKEHPEVFELIPTPRTPTDDELRSFEQAHPELAGEIDAARKETENDRAGFRDALVAVARKHPELWSLLRYDRDVTTLRKYAEDFIEARFETVVGVANSNVLGGREEEVQVIVDPERLAARQLTVNDLRNALRGQNKDTSGGDFWELKRRYSVRTLGQFRTAEQVEGAIVARRDNKPVYVRDVAHVVRGHKKPDGFVARFGGHCIAVNVERAIGANVLEVMERLRASNAQLNEGRLRQEHLKLVQVYDETNYIYSARSLVVDNLVEGAILTFFTLLLFLRNGRSTIIIFIHILVSTIGAFLVMKLMGRSLNVPALGGLAFAVGMLVDNAIVMLENVFRRRQLGDSPLSAAVRGSSEVSGALLNATLANLAVFLPVLFIKEEAGQLFRDIAIAISASVAFSMVVAITVVPTAAMRLLRTYDGGSGNIPGDVHAAAARRRPGIIGFFLGLWGRFTWFLDRVLLAPVDWVARGFVNGVVGFNGMVMKGYTGVVIRLGMIVLFVGGGLLLSWLMVPKVEYLPNGNQNLCIGILLPPPGYNLNQLKEMGEQVEAELQPYWDVDPDSEEAKELEFPAIGDFFFVARQRMVFLGLRAADPMRAAELVPLVQSVASKLPGTFVRASQASLFEQALTGGRTIDIEITGPDLEKLVELGGRVFGQFLPRPEVDPETGEMKMVQLIPGAQAFPRPSLDLSNPEVHVVPKWEQAADMQITADELGYAVDTLVDGAYAADFYSGGDRIDLRIMGESRFAERTQDLESLPIVTRAGELVPLAAIADVQLRSGPEQINHHTRQRTITISVSPPPNVALEQAMDIIAAQVVKPLEESGALRNGYRIELAGTADKLRSTWQSLRFNFLLAVLITYLFMAATFESWLYPFIVMLTVPLGAVGGFVGLWVLNWYALGQFTAPSLDVLTMLGFFMLVGTVVNNPILIVEQGIANIRDEHMGVREAILDSLRNRFRPIFMTTLGGLVGLLPLVIAPGAGSELYRGIGAVLLGGMVFSTFVTLFFVPALFSLAVEAQQAVLRLLGWDRFDELSRESAPYSSAATEPAGFFGAATSSNGNGTSGSGTSGNGAHDHHGTKVGSTGTAD
jgi:hydrophobic/amphiphilic exporter-1 (mainly G- bacteria), HAE1 family